MGYFDQLSIAQKTIDSRSENVNKFFSWSIMWMRDSIEFKYNDVISSFNTNQLKYSQWISCCYFNQSKLTYLYLGDNWYINIYMYVSMYLYVCMYVCMYVYSREIRVDFDN